MRFVPISLFCTHVVKKRCEHIVFMQRIISPQKWDTGDKF